MREDFDRELDAALAGYSDVEPRPGLDQRVLHHLETSGHTRRWWIWWALAGPPLLAGFAVFLWLRVPQQPKFSPLAVGIRTEIATVAVPPVSRVRISKPRPSPLPKLDVFPSPSPLTSEERMLLVYAQHASPTRNSDSIEFPVLTIEPLPTGAEDEGQ